ncbi:MAG: metal-dependent transcriptional regulator [Desulfurococcaceae archaeon]
MRKNRVEEYLETIYELYCCGERIGIRRLAKKLGVKPSSVIEYLKKLCEEGYIVYEKGGLIMLTNKGFEIAREIKNRHNVIKEFLKILGVSEEIAEIDACYIEHGVHEETIEKIQEFVNKNRTQSRV